MNSPCNLHTREKIKSSSSARASNVHMFACKAIDAFVRSLLERRINITQACENSVGAGCSADFVASDSTMLP